MDEQDDEQHEKPEETGAPQKGGPETFHQELRHSQVTARVPESIGRGVFSTGSIVMQGPHEFVIDFLQSMAQPHRVAARVVLPPTVVPLFLAALQENLNKFQQHFGPPPKLPSPPPGAQPPPISDIYEALKLPDEMLGGTYANAVMILHTPSEFCFDFIMSAYPALGCVEPDLPVGSPGATLFRIAIAGLRPVPQEARPAAPAG